MANAVVMDDSSGAAWAVALTLDDDANARLATLAHPTGSLLSTEVAVSSALRQILGYTTP